MYILAAGPYIGSFEHEIITFRPYIKWLTKVLKYDKIYLNAHSNRSFLYDDFIKNITNVFENISRDEENQSGYIYSKVKQNDFNIIVRKYKDEIIDREGCSKREIHPYYLNYTKSIVPYPIYNKIFTRIRDIDDVKIESNKIVYIPSTNCSEDRCRKIYDYLISTYDDVVVVGDTNTYLKNQNSVLNRIDYFINGWKINIKNITEAKAVICPLSYWTVISNLQSVPVFSWGENVSQYREGGIYNLDNKDCFTLATSDDTDIKIITKMIDYFLKPIEDR